MSFLLIAQFTTCPCIADCDAILTDMLHNKLAPILTLLSDTREYIVGLLLQGLYTPFEYLNYFPPSLFPWLSAHSPSSLLSLAGTHLVWHKHCCKVPFPPFITIAGSDFLHGGNSSPEDPTDFHTGIHCRAREQYTHTHSFREHAEEDTGCIIFTFLFINHNLSVYPLVLSSW